MLLELVFLIAAEADASGVLAAYRAKTRADVECQRPGDSEAIIVCGARRADRYRVPFVDYDLGDPRHEGVEAERQRLQHRTTPCQDRGPFLIGCGSVGVHASTRVGGDGITGARLRPLAR